MSGKFSWNVTKSTLSSTATKLLPLDMENNMVPLYIIHFVTLFSFRLRPSIFPQFFKISRSVSGLVHKLVSYRVASFLRYIFLLFFWMKSYSIYKYSDTSIVLS